LIEKIWVRGTGESKKYDVVFLIAVLGVSQQGGGPKTRGEKIHRGSSETISIPLPKKARKKLPVIFCVVFSRPLIRGGYTKSATNQGPRKKWQRIFCCPFWGEGVT
jgi:hypothetical protein